MQKDFTEKLITEVHHFDIFKPNIEKYQNYYRNNPEKPFCTNYIDPKLSTLRKRFKKYTHP